MKGLLLFQLSKVTKSMLLLVNNNCTYYSLVDVLDNAVSNSVIDIPVDSVLSDVVHFEHLENIKIIGHGNPSIDCDGVGALHFVSCHKVTIEGITWRECGFKGESVRPGITLDSSSTIKIKNCAFHNCTSQAVVLSNIAGDVSINNCSFTHNNEYSDHGTAIHYTPGNTNKKFFLVIRNGVFSHNGIAKSVVYIGGSADKQKGKVCLQNSSFTNNQGVPVYVSYHRLHLNGSVTFDGNSAINGGAIYGHQSIITFNGESGVNFSHNSVSYSGGAIYLNESDLNFQEFANITFNENSAESGGAIFSKFLSHVSFNDNTSVFFTHNNATFGGAVYCKNNSTVSFTDHSVVNFDGNNASRSAGSVFIQECSKVIVSGKSSVTFKKKPCQIWRGNLFYRSFGSIV